MRTPSVIDESLIRPFKYWREGIHQGGIYNNEIYICLRSFSTEERLKAYETAFEHTDKNATVCISVSPQGYTVWLGLRSLNSVVNQSLAVCQ